MPTLPTRHRVRLPRTVYSQLGTACSVTIAVRGRRRVFVDPRVANATVTVLREHAARTGTPVYGYCVMPDHVHLVVGASPACDIVTFVGQFKNLAQRAAWGHGVAGAFWQTGFWDHVLQQDEQVDAVVRYVLHNPVRGGLVASWRDYPFCGSLVFDLGDEDFGW